MSTNRTCPISSSISCLISAAILIHAETRYLQFASRTEVKASFGEVAGRPLRRSACFTIEEIGNRTKGGRPSRAARREGYFGYCPVPLAAASACFIFAAISAFTASRLKLAPRCIGG